MTTARFDTAQTIVNEAAVELGLSSSTSTDVFGSTDATFVQLRTLLKSCGQELIGLPGCEWPSLHKTASITAAAAAAPAVYGVNSLPTDFERKIPGTTWNQTDDTPVYDVTPQAWEAAIVSSSTPTTSLCLIDADRFLLYSDSSGDTVTFRYQSRYWLAAAGASSTLSKAAPTANDDVVFFTPLLLKRLLKLRYAQAKELPTASLLADFEATLAIEQGKHTPSLTLNLQGGVRGVRFLDGYNVRDTGYGS